MVVRFLRRHYPDQVRGSSAMALLSARQHRAPRAIQLLCEYTGLLTRLSSKDLTSGFNIVLNLGDQLIYRCKSLLTPQSGYELQFE